MELKWPILVIFFISASLPVKAEDAQFKVEYHAEREITEVTAEIGSMTLEFIHAGEQAIPPAGWVRASAGDPNRVDSAKEIIITSASGKRVEIRPERAVQLGIDVQTLRNIASEQSLTFVFRWPASGREVVQTVNDGSMAVIRKIAEYGKDSQRRDALSPTGFTAYLVDISESMTPHMPKIQSRVEAVINSMRDDSPRRPQSFILTLFADKSIHVGSRSYAWAAERHKRAAIDTLKKAVPGPESAKGLAFAFQGALDINARTIILITDGTMHPSEISGFEGMLRRSQGRLNLLLVGDGNSESRKLLEELSQKTFGTVERIQ